MTAIRIMDFGPAQHWARPGDTITVTANLGADAPVRAKASITLLDVAREVDRVERELELGLDAARPEVSFVLPHVARRGYGLRLDVHAGGAVTSASSALEAIDGWWESPRHAAVTRYDDSAEAKRAAGDLADWHVTVMQHYDWMWRHYQYLPPEGARSFDDALGRMVSHDAVRASIEAGHAAGIASLAYGSVYGAEPEYVAEHPDERVFDEDGQALSLGGTFHINDIRPGSPWRERLLGEYDAAIDAFPFDGIHMDTYGPPHAGVSADGSAIDFASLYPSLIDEAAIRVAARRPATRVLFNCVDGFPLDAVAPSATACLYLELWPPDRSFADVVRWIDRARALADERQVVIAAYAATLRDDVPATDRGMAMEAVLLLGGVIAAAGAYHHALAEGDRLLVEGYYPAAVPMRPPERDAMRTLWRFGARFVHLLSSPGLEVVDADGLSIIDASDRAVDWSSQPAAGHIWVRVARLDDGRRVLHLIDLRDQPDDYWDTPKCVAEPTVGLSIEWAGLQRPVAASPWHRDGDASPLQPLGHRWQLPDFERWLMVVEAQAEA